MKTSHSQTVLHLCAIVGYTHHFKPDHILTKFSLVNHRINPDYHATLMTLATLLSDTGRTGEGYQYMQRAVDVAPQDPVVRNNMAAFLIRQGESCSTLYTVYVCTCIYSTIQISSLSNMYKIHTHTKKCMLC